MAWAPGTPSHGLMAVKAACTALTAARLGAPTHLPWLASDGPEPSRHARAEGRAGVLVSVLRQKLLCHAAQRAATLASAAWAREPPSRGGTEAVLTFRGPPCLI